MAVILGRLLLEQAARADEIAQAAAAAVAPIPVHPGGVAVPEAPPPVEVASLRRDLGELRADLAQQRGELAEVYRFLRPSRFKPW